MTVQFIFCLGVETLSVAFDGFSETTHQFKSCNLIGSLFHALLLARFVVSVVCSIVSPANPAVVRDASVWLLDCYVFSFAFLFRLNCCRSTKQRSETFPHGIK